MRDPERRSLYKTKDWYKLRNRRLKAEPFCRMCSEMNVRTAGEIVDHKTPHRGDPVLFYDFNNTQSLCKLHHDSVKKSHEMRGYDRRIGADGWPIDPEHPFNKGSSK